MLAEEFSYAGPFYHHHLTEELRQTDYQRDKQERYSLYCLVLILGTSVLVTVIQYHRLNMELDLQSLFGLLCTAVLIGCYPATPPPTTPRILAHIRRRYWSAKIDDISFNPLTSI